ncbi:ABC transporter permease [Wenxinia marina]|uniref:ABC-type dipeptide/oligopeptide/nickel transport system, permease component n=1 Tax=Wenxinia marina DSM 24838 TaxID=1123501 RepID=A0A0D0P9P4_9RHOB|nr:ABC transporter permease [Wenxinia marina]KIQ68226.1 ABC-type dipeptide/oligopeptide/nickel transport system, permease component [Wenxinia marina DSM 24838]GGL76860.1 peptide ABC transporter [Wenxinia marina]
MLHFLAKRLPSVALMLVVTAVIAFLLPRLGGGDPAQVVAGSDATAEQVQAIREQMGLDRPLPVQFAEWVGQVATGDLGTSLISNRPVAQLIGARLGSTLELAVTATALMIVMGLGLGILAGITRKGAPRALLDGAISVLLATPPHVTGLILILIFGITWRLMPITGEVSVFDDPVRGFSYLIMPAFALALPQAAMIARLVDARMAQVRQEEFVDLAVAKGVPPRRILLSHVLRNSLGTAVIATGIRIGEILAGAVVIEAIFARQGLGMLAVTSISSRDYEVVQIIVLFAVVIAVLVHFASEILLAALDPRIRLDG